MLVTVITGSRDWTDDRAIERALEGSDALIVGDCPTGADWLSLIIAKAWDIIPVVLRVQGARNPENLLARNVEVAKTAAQYRADGFDVRCHAFPLTGNGTWHCTRQLRQRGFSVLICK